MFKSLSCRIFGLCLFLAVTAPVGATGKPWDLDFQKLDQTHDLELPPWGPYSKKYEGISHIPDIHSGLRFDVSLFAGIYRGRVVIPNTLFESGCYPWDANADLRRITYRYELEWKDKVYVDVTYSTLDSNTVLASMRCVNHSPLVQSLALNLMASLDYPENYPSVVARLPAGSRWINAVDYRELSFAHPRPTDHLVFDGWQRGEVRGSDYLDASAIGKDFGKEAGDQVSYAVKMPPKSSAGTITFRYRLKENAKVTFVLKGLASQKLDLVGTGKFELMAIPFTNAPAEDATLELISEGRSGIELNGFFISSTEDSKKLQIEPSVKAWTPKILRGESPGVILKYDDTDTFYGIASDFEPSVVREFFNDELDVLFRKVQNNLGNTFKGNEQGHYTDVFLRPVVLKPNSERTVQALICNGGLEAVKSRLTAFTNSPAKFASRAAPAENSFTNILPQGEKYVFSQKLMRATTLGNIVYPIYTQRNYIRNFTPGKCWNCLYTWDDGFVSLGLGGINRDLAAECLNTYTTPADSQSAFIHHGSMVPVQFYAFLELWNKTQSREMLDYFYPRLKRYYEFFTGNAEGSSTRKLHSNLLKTWDYFYNSGGWDDYPPQKAVHARHLEKTVAPAITTAQAIRIAKIMRLAAENLSLSNDVTAYDADIKMFSAALQTSSWDENTGYFSYVTHDENGRATGHFLDATSGADYNLGLDGAHPLTSGICTPKQQERLLGKIFSNSNLWTSSGISVVDQSAPYFRNDGYWNGTVWMPHQWFIWKTMLDLGRPDLAWQIAQTGLDLWKRETDETYHCFEHFMIETGRGAGWYQFSGLSTPVLLWFSAYYQQGTVTTGNEIFIQKQEFASSNSGYEADLAFDEATAAHPRCLLACLNPDHHYEVFFDGKKLESATSRDGLVEVVLPATNAPGKILIKAVAH